MRCDWKPRWPGDFMLSCTKDHGIGVVGNVNHHTKDSFIGFKLLHGFYHPIPDLKMMIDAMEEYAEEGWLKIRNSGNEEAIKAAIKRHANLLARLRQELETVEKATAHLPVGDEDSQA